MQAIGIEGFESGFKELLWDFFLLSELNIMGIFWIGGGSGLLLLAYYLILFPVWEMSWWVGVIWWQLKQN
jgi:hypothetical protein